MDLQYFLNILWRRKWLILTVMLAAAVATYYFVDRKVDTYKATSTMTAGIIGEDGDLGKENPWIMEFMLKMGFENVIQSITSRRNVNFLSFRLLLHDLYPDSTYNGEVFRKLEDMEDVKINYTPEQIEELLAALQTKLDILENTFDSPEQEAMFSDLAKAFKYDHENLVKYNLNVERSGDTDNLIFQFESENPKLSAFAADIFAKDYIRIHRKLEQSEGDTAVDFLSQEVREKKRRLMAITTQLDNYRMNNNVFDAGKQSQAVISRKNSLRNDLEMERSKIPAIQQNIGQVSKLLNEKQNQRKGSKDNEIENNTAIQNMKAEIGRLNNRIIESNNTDKEAIKLLELVQKNLADRRKALGKIYRDKENAPNNEKTESDLFTRKLELNTQLNDALSRIKTIEIDLKTLDQQQSGLVSNDAVIKQLEAEKDILDKEYQLLLGKYQQKSLESRDTYHPLKILEHARVPERAEPKMKLILTGFAGVVGGVMSTVFIFLAAFFDTSVNSPSKFRKFSGVNLLGTLNKVKTKNLDLQHLFSSNGDDKSYGTFRESLRNLRHTIENSGGKKFLFTSTKKQEGKTFMIITLAYAMSIKSKKILIIDTNFKNNELTKMSKKTIQDNMLNSKLIGENDLESEFVSKSIDSHFNLNNVDIIGNKGTYQSPSEVFADKNFNKFLDGLEDQYDYIFFEGAPMNTYSDTKELVEFVDKVVTVFAAESDIKQIDKDSILFLKSLGGKFMGAILNKVNLKDLN